MTISKELKDDVKEFSVVMSMSVGLLVISLVFVYSIVRNYVDVNSILGGNFGGKQIYLYLPDENYKRVKQIGLEKNYQRNIDFIESIKSYKIIKIESLKNIDKNIPLLLIDNFVLTKDEKYQLKKYLKNGGSLIFNFNVDKTFVKQITNLTNEGYIQKDKDHIFFLVQNLLSPIKIPSAKRLDIVLYDKIPIFSGKSPILEWSNWAMNDGIYDNNSKLPNGAVWSGNYGKGKWIYFSFPLYSFSAVKSQKIEYKKLFESMLNFAFYKYEIVKYPYLDSQKMIFISEDTEFRFENLGNFSNTIQKLDVNATAFCVGKLAEKHLNLMKKVGAMKQIEIASHSYSHTDLLKASRDKLDVEVRLNKILLHNLSKQNIVGFRPPREQTNAKLREFLKENNFKYVLEKNINQLRPKFDENLMIMPRLGTDDYAYLIQLDWDKNKIINRAVQEMNFITNLGAIYTLSTHTHLLSYKTNIKVLEEIIKKFKQFNIPILKGKDITKKIIETKNIKIKKTITLDNILLNIVNNNDTNIKNFTFRAYGKIDKVSSDFLTIKAKIIKKTDEYVDVRIENLPKFADVTLFLGIK